MPAEPHLETLGVAKLYGDGSDGTTALAGVDLAVQPGETVALVGESGSCKTTLRTFNRMVEPSAGDVRVGRPVAGLDAIALRRRLGYWPMIPATFGSPTFPSLRPRIGRLGLNGAHERRKTGSTSVGITPSVVTQRRRMPT